MGIWNLETFKIWNFWRSDFKWSLCSHISNDPDHMKTRKNGRFSLDHCLCNKILFIPKYSLAKWTIRKLTKVEHLKSGHVRISDPNCCLKRPTKIYLYINSICRCNYWGVDKRARPIWWGACRSIYDKRGPLFRKADKFVRRIVETRVNSMLKVRRSRYVDLLLLFWKHFVQTET